MLSKRMREELNKQIGVELSAAYQYFAMAAYAAASELDGFKSWLLHQAEEEISHGMKISNYLLDRGEKVKPPAVPAPKADYKSMVEVFEKALANEEGLGEQFNRLAEAAKSEKDHATYVFLEWFLTEQVEEVASCNHILEKLKMVGKDSSGLLILDAEMAKRGSSD